MASGLWQRLRAARRYADKRQQDISDACGVSRGAVAQWESAEPGHRTRPGITELMTVSRTTGVPVEWLMNDASDPNDVFKVGTLYGAAPPPAPTRNGHNSQVGGLPVAPPAPSNRALETFIRAVEFAVMEQDPEIAAGFRVRGRRLSSESRQRLIDQTLR